MTTTAIDLSDLACVCEYFDNLLSKVSGIELTRLVNRCHGQKLALGDNPNVLNLFGLWSKVDSSTKRVFNEAMSLKIQGGNYHKPLNVYLAKNYYR